MQPDSGLHNIIYTLSRYAGNLPIDIIINVDEVIYTIAKTTVDSLLLSI